MKGSCLCGEVTYEVDRLATPIQHCSCHTCRKAHAAAFNTVAGVDPQEFRWLQGQHALRAYESSPGKRRYFCSSCGSHLIAMREGASTFTLRVATLDEHPGSTPEFQIWQAHEAPWLAYGPQIPAYSEWQPGRM